MEMSVALKQTSASHHARTGSLRCVRSGLDGESETSCGWLCAGSAVGQSMRVTGVLSDAGLGCQVLDGFILEEGAVGYLCVEVYFATSCSYVYLCIQVVGADGVLPMLHTQTEIEGARGDESPHIVLLAGRIDD
jgi:hypothetical protein